MFDFAGVHVKYLCGEHRYVNFFKILFTEPGAVLKGNPGHSVNTERPEFPVFMVIPQKIIVLIYPDQCKRAHNMDFSVMAQLFLFLKIISKVLKRNDTVIVDCFGYFVHIVVNAFIHGLYPVADIDGSVQGLGFVNAGQGSNLFYQLPGFRPGDEV